MNISELTNWLQQQQPTLEKIILNAAQAYDKDHSSKDNFGYDLDNAQKEGYNLMNGLDLCYDRYTTPFTYSLWYQGRRINVFLSHFSGKIIEACKSNQPIDIFDLGAGTGCVQFCFGLACVAFKRAGANIPMIRIINIDSSPFMLQYLNDYLWPQALIHYPELSLMPVDYNICSWNNKSDVAVINPWICASYLFDSSDNEDYLVSHFNQLIDDFKPEKVLMLTSAQNSKKKLLDSLSKKLQNQEYIVTSSSSKYIFNGNMEEVTSFRKGLVSKYNLKASPKSVCWNDGSFTSLGLEKRQTGLTYGFEDIPQSYNLYNQPLKVRREVVLNDQQLKAAAYDMQPVIITGPAGCGKSVVVTEKIINTIDFYKWSLPLYILVTTFNKSLLKQLRLWITDLLEKKGKSITQFYYLVNGDKNDGTGEILVKGSVNIRIKFVHFEMLGKYIGKIQNIAYEEIQHRNKIEKLIQQVRLEFDIKESEYTDVLSVDFILEEHHRVIYGLGCKLSEGEDKYQNLKREGRGNRVQLNKGPKRRAVWQVLLLYAKWMHEDPAAGHSFIARRQLLLNELSGINSIEKFDYVFVDEFQDCTPADFKIMIKLLKDVNNLILSGDLAQAVHIGQSGIIPRDEAMSRRRYYRLNGSYRLPYRISEAIQPLSRHITVYSEDKEVTLEITPSKGAPPGARPIFVYSNNNISLAKKILLIKKSYESYDLRNITILESDNSLCKALNDIQRCGETTTILKLKGLEKEMIVWSLQAHVEYQNEVMEFVYTILTRTNCILVIAVLDTYNHYYLPSLKLIRQDRLIFWDSESEIIFQKLIE